MKRKRMINYDAINRVALARLPDLCALWLPDGQRLGNEFVALNPRRDDRGHGSFRINLLTGRWADFAIDARGGDPISLLAYLKGIKQSSAALQLAEILGVHND
jgi:hypothetical protein